MVENTTYDPWGEVLSGGTSSKYLYTGQEKDSETGLSYYNARYYNSNIRRFAQPDDIIQDVYNPQDLNRYSYTLNNPLRYTDPSGHFVMAVPLAYWVVGAAVTAFSEYLATPHGQAITKVAINAVVNGTKSIVNAASNTIKSATTVFNSSKSTAPPASNHSQSNSTVNSNQGNPQIPNMNPLQKLGPAIPPTFSSTKKLIDHFERHGENLGFNNINQYLNGARSLFNGGEGVEAVVRTSNGDQGFFRPSTGEFGVLDKTGGIIKTYFKPEGDPSNYWFNESGFFK